MMTLCQQHKFASSADRESTYEATNNGAIFTQLLALADVSGLDGQYICNKLHSTYCPMPYTRPATVNFPSAKPASAAAPVSSGNRIKVLHLSDYHLDPRCDAGNLYGIYNHDTSYYLGASLLQSIGPLTGTSKTGVGNSSLAFSIFTGDMVVHDSLPHLSRNLTTYSETSVFDQFKYFLSGPVFPLLGNHDSNPQGIDAPHSLGYLGQQQSWNYEHVAGQWQNDGWLTPEAANEARTHYAAYGINHAQYPKLKIIALNTDFWYVDTSCTSTPATLTPRACSPGSSRSSSPPKTAPSASGSSATSSRAGTAVRPCPTRATCSIRLWSANRHMSLRLLSGAIRMRIKSWCTMPITGRSRL